MPGEATSLSFPLRFEATLHGRKDGGGGNGWWPNRRNRLLFRREWTASAKLRANLWSSCILPFLLLFAVLRMPLRTNVACSSIVRVTRIGETRAVRSSTGGTPGK